VLNHLIQNAADAAGPDGHVSVSLGIRSGQEGREDEDGSAPQQWAELIIADSGPGMDAAFINEKLFQPLDSTKAAGFGIGAYQCRQHIKELGGRLLVDSVVGAGTRMIVRLPLAAERPSSSRAASAAPQGIYTHA
jgi:signal transduction histidine kinase